MVIKLDGVLGPYRNEMPVEVLIRNNPCRPGTSSRVGDAVRGSGDLNSLSLARGKHTWLGF